MSSDISVRRPYDSGASASPIGQVLSVRGSEANVGLRAPLLHRGDSRPTVGKFLAIEVGDSTIVGMIAEVTGRTPETREPGEHRAVARIDLMGEILRGPDGTARFQRGVREYPAIGDTAKIISSDDLRVIYSSAGSDGIAIGHLNQDPSIPAFVDVDDLIAKHFAVLGSTGVGKSSGVAVILGEILSARPDLRVLVLDGHNEYGHSFGDRANLIGARNLKLPFWLFNFEEIIDVIYGGRPSVPEEVEILAELIPIAKGSYQQLKSTADRPMIKRRDPRMSGFTVDTPVPYLLQDLLTLIDERMGKLENRSTRMAYHRLTMRIEALKNDPRYAFMFENANVGGDTMATLLSQLFRLDPAGKPLTILQLASLPVEVVDAVVCVVSRLAFDLGLWSDGAFPLLFVCEEAHRYASADHSLGFGPARRALSRIAKEGRKYGVYLGLVTQRPAELDPTIISQCSTLFAMRMANDQDQALLRSAVSDATAHLLDFIPSLGTGEVVGFGEGMPLPARITFNRLPANLVPRSESSTELPENMDDLTRADFVKAVVDRWRGATMNQASYADDGGSLAQPGANPAADAAQAIQRGLLADPAERDEASTAAARLLDKTRYSILKR